MCFIARGIIRGFLLLIIGRQAGVAIFFQVSHLTSLEFCGIFLEGIGLFSDDFSGTVIDTKICHQREFDFYLNSHAGIQVLESLYIKIRWILLPASILDWTNKYFIG